MKLITLLILMTLPATAFAGQGAAERYFAASLVPADVQAANDAFLRGDFAELGKDIKRALLNHAGDPAVQENMLALFDKAYELKGDHAIPPDWKVPAEITWITVGSRKRYHPINGDIEYRIGLYADLIPGQEFEQLRLVRYPDEVIFDKQLGLGEFEPGFEDGHPNMFVAQDTHHSKSAEGLYLLTFKLKGQSAVDGWLVMSRLNASESPAITVPVVNQVLETATPTFQWNDFVSPEYRSFEYRKIYASVTERRSDVKDNSWSVNVKPPLVQAKIGAGLPEEMGAKSLHAGDYSFQVSYRERFHFGDLVISRDSATIAPFSIK